VRADGWFERLGEGSPNFDQLCEAVGDRFVAFSVVAGVRITALTVDRRSPDATLVDFVVGEEDGEQRLPLGEFRRRLCSALLEDEPVPDLLPSDPDADAIQAFIGFRYVLLAPIFGLTLEQLTVGGDEPPSLVVRLGETSEELDVQELREVVRDRIRSELARSRPQSPFSIDLGTIPKAEDAADEQDWERVIDLLGAWPGPLSLLLRTTEGQQLTPDVKATLARALGYLGTAYVHRGRFDWAEEVMRLGIQWGQDGPAAGERFRRLGESCVARGRQGEAIGLLRRALALGAPRRDVLPTLAQCYADRGRWVASAVCAEESVALGADREEMEDIRDRAAGILGDAWTRFRERVPPPSTVGETIPAPGEER